MAGNVGCKQPTVALGLHVVPFQEVPPASAECQLALLVTHRTDFNKGQVSGLSQEEKQL